MNTIKEEVKPIDIKAQNDLDRLKEKYKDQKKETNKEIPKHEPEIINQINPQEIEQEIEMLNGIYNQTTKRNLPNPAILSYKMGSMSYQKKHGKSPLELMDKYPFMYFVAFGLFVITDIVANLPKRKSQNNQQQEKTNNAKSEQPEEVTKNIEVVKPIGATEDLN
tara:strand:- start:951 stop:1445 length:495 start_codon:yes stop_codon:yes gene_type:complete